jgi:hypothetical protein
VDPVVAVRRGGRRKGSGKRADGTAPWALRAIQALSDGSRWAIVQYLSEHEATVGSIARQQGLSVACTSKHLSILSECRLARAGSEASDLLAALGIRDRVEARESAVEAPAEWRGSAPELEPSRRPKVIRYQSNDLDDYLL